MAPIELNFYTKSFAIEKTHIKTHITWGDYKDIMKAQEDIQGMSGEEAAARIGDYMVAFFDGAFSRSALEKKAVGDDVMACFYSILAQCHAAVSAVNFRRGTVGPSPDTMKGH